MKAKIEYSVWGGSTVTAYNGYDGSQDVSYTGKDRDATGLYYFHARYYDPVAGRFYSEDPVRDGGNWFVYCGNNPLSSTDPTGLDAGIANWENDKTYIDGIDRDGYGDRQKERRVREAVVDNAIEAAAQASGLTTNGQKLTSLVNGTVLLVNLVSGVNNLVNAIDDLILAAGKGGIPETLARVIPGDVKATTLGRPGATDVFVTAADDIAGMTPAQIAERLTIPTSKSFTVVEFPTPSSGLASPVFRTNPGFVGGGFTAGGAREFVLPNGPIPAGATIRLVK